MRHLFVAGFMLVAGLAITFGTASVLQSVATARVNAPAEPFFVEAIRPPIKPMGAKERVVQSRERLRSETRLAGR